jgi:hypothetical protein
MSELVPITVEAIKLYVAFDGDVDAYQRRGSPQPSMMRDAWRIIPILRTNLFIIANGRASANFAAQTERDLQAWTADEKARGLIRDLVSRDLARHLNAV